MKTLYIIAERRSNVVPMKGGMTVAITRNASRSAIARMKIVRRTMSRFLTV
ncbi:hypothetical protein ANCCAN_16151 [Ancylostoma caninum]|uniref:Uncharacterized protein n=1 Tax=Ancylostoma caninum TaxID=29170 RepID=A0A368G2N1_ANCCA|nr:hypothetical protein ANCCAN_16151 [Ancylostoma caninum]